MTSKNICCAQVFRFFNLYPCGVNAKFERDGKHYCGKHDPVAIAKKEAARREKWAAKLDVETIKHQASTEQKRRAGCYDDMLKELEDILEWHKFETVPLRARELESIKKVIEKATGVKQ